MDKPPDPCTHPLRAVIAHPTKPGKSICRGCGLEGKVMTKIGGLIMPKVELK